MHVHNDPLTQPSCNLATQKFKNIFSSNFYSPFIQEPTRITEHSATLIDNIYCNVPELSSNSAAGILKVSISDHYAIFCILKYATIQDKTKIVKKKKSVKKILPHLLHDLIMKIGTSFL